MDKTAGGSQGLGGVVKQLVKTFLEPEHYQKLHKILAEQWKDCHSLSAAVRLMEAHGVKVSAEEEQRLSSLPEELMIDELVQRMPQQSREQFEHFFLQLSFIASTTTRLRQALEAGVPEVIEEALESAENVGVLPYFMKMAVAQAGNEVKVSETSHDEWLEEADTKMGPLLSSQASSMVTQKALAQAKAMLTVFQAESKESSQRVLLGLADGNDQALVASTFTSWSGYTVKVRKEAEIRKEYQERIDVANQALFEYREKQLATVKSVFMRNGKEAEDALVMSCIAALKQEAEDIKRAQAEELLLKDLEGKTKAFAEAAAENAKKVMARMNDGNDEGLKMMGFQAWKQALDELKAEKIQNEAIKASQAQMEAFMKKQKEGAGSVLTKMMGANDTGLLVFAMKGWREVLQEEKDAAAMEQILAQKATQLGGFASRNKNSAMSAQERCAALQSESMLIYIFAFWKRDSKVERIKRIGREKNMKRKQELLGVKGLFKNFATELESSLKEGTPRQEMSPKAMTGPVC